MVTVPIWKVLLETWIYKIFLNPLSGIKYDWNQRKMKVKTFLSAKPGHEKVLTLQKPFQI